MRKGNITEERFETVKKLVHDDPVAMDIVERFQSAYSATVKRQKRLDIIVDISLTMCLITVISCKKKGSLFTGMSDIV